MKKWARSPTAGFTIVELLIVIIVIGILAALVLVAYNNVTAQANTSTLKNDLEQVAKQLNTLKESAGGGTSYPTDASALTYSANTYLQYTFDNTANPATYCVTASNTVNGLNYFVSNTSQSPAAGYCPGHNQLIWDKAKLLTASMPVPGAALDTSTFRTSTASMRLGPGVVGQGLKNSPFTDAAGTVYKVTLWMKTDSTWNGTNNNSKIRFGNVADGSPIVVCGYAGVKTSWTQVTCSYTMTASIPTVAISVGNDGTTGNVWIDDLTFSKN